MTSKHDIRPFAQSLINVSDGAEEYKFENEKICRCGVRKKGGYQASVAHSSSLLDTVRLMYLNLYSRVKLSCNIDNTYLSTLDFE